MTPEQVPADLLKIADQNYSMHGLGLMHNILAAVLTEHEKQVREQVAQEIEAAAPPDPRGSAMPNFVGAAMRQAADIARGGAR